MPFLLLTRLAPGTFHLHDLRAPSAACGTLDQLAIHDRMRRLPVAPAPEMPPLRSHQLRIARIGARLLYLETLSLGETHGRVLSFPAALQLLHSIAVQDKLASPRGFVL